MAYAIGDIHGCLNTLQDLIRQIPRDEELVFLGDYVDRGPDSYGVIKFLEELARDRPCYFIMGNHELMMKRAIDDREQIPFWLLNGGENTLNSYQISSNEWKQLPDRGSPLGNFLRFYDTLSYYHEDENSIYVHAGIDLNIDEMSKQDPEVLLWIRDRSFQNASNWKGKQVVFGHTPTQSMGLSHGKVFQSHGFFGIDTGCVYDGMLTAINTKTHEILQSPLLDTLTRPW